MGRATSEVGRDTRCVRRSRAVMLALGLVAALARADAAPATDAPVADAPAADPSRAPRSGRGSPPRQARRTVDGVAFVADARCAECHAEQAEAWRGSHHDLAMQPASAETVLGDFADVTFEQHGVKTRFSVRDGRYLVHTEGPDGTPAEFEIAYTFGVEPLQQYLVPFPGGRLQPLSVAWDVERRRWFHLQPDERIPPGDPLHWTGRYQTWNAMCAECHSTDLRKGYDPDTDRYDTRWAEIDVGCQACHGPGGGHVAWAESRAGGGKTPVAEQAAKPGKGRTGLVVDLVRASAHEQVDACARCHSRRHRVSADDRHGRPLLDDFLPATLDEGLYHPDGQILEEVYVYGSFVQSRMYAAGVRCSDCHDPHTLRLREEGDALCLRCHRTDPPEAFPGLVPRRYDAATHHGHPPESEGARCVSCHMPSRTYMVVDPRRDHGLRVPRPDLSRTLGTPNACNGCHADRSAAWAQERIEAWHGAVRTRGPSWAAAIHDGRAGDPGALPALAALARSQEAPAIVRATAVSLLPLQGEAAIETLADALRDPDPLVRTRAVRALAALPPDLRARWLVPALDDPLRAVRGEAAAQLAGLPADGLDDAQRESLARALAEYEAAQYAMSDLPAGRMSLGILRTAQGRSDEAVRAYETAIEMDPAFFPAHANLAQLHAANGRPAEAEAVLRRGIARLPDESELHYSLGLLLAEHGRMPEAVEALRRAARGMPDRARVHYNLGLAEQQAGSPARAEQSLLHASRLDPTEPAYVHALAILYAQQRRWDDAIVQARRLVELVPDSPAARSLLDGLERARARGGAG